MEEETTKTLVPLEKYLESGVHIGSKFRSGDMKKFIYKTRNDGLCVLDINTINERIETAAKFIAQYEPKDVLVVAGRAYAQKPAKKFAETIGASQAIGRFTPGTLTNPSNEKFMEPKLLITADPPVDRQAIKEAIKAKVPVLSLCDTSNLTRNIDYIIPMNNKGKKALALVYWLLSREVLKARGTISSDDDFTEKIEDYEAKITIRRPEEEETSESPMRRPRQRQDDRSRGQSRGR
ncbi:MAG: 30S ribosomal protein S2 [archaeon]